MALPAFLALVSPASSAASLGYTAHKAHREGSDLALGWVAVGVGLVLAISILQPAAPAVVAPTAPVKGMGKLRRRRGMRSLDTTPMPIVAEHWWSRFFNSVDDEAVDIAEDFGAPVSWFSPAGPSASYPDSQALQTASQSPVDALSEPGESNEASSSPILGPTSSDRNAGGGNPGTGTGEYDL